MHYITSACNYLKDLTYQNLVEPFENLSSYMPEKELVERITRNYKDINIESSAVLLTLIASFMVKDEGVSDLLQLGVILFTAKNIIPELWGAMNWVKIHRMAEEQLTAINDKKAALIVTSTFDHNGAIDCIHRDTLNSFKEISKDYQIFFTRTGSIKEINHAIHKVSSSGKEIGLLFVMAHGAPKSIQLSENKFIHKYNIHKLNFSELSADATILLHSCSTGAKIKGINIAERFQFYAGSCRKIIAPCAELYSVLCRYNSGNKTFSMIHPMFNGSIISEISIEILAQRKNYS